jgi:hypothetical protein
MMEAVRTSETSVKFNVTTWRYIPEDTKLQGHHNIFRRLIVSENHIVVFHNSSLSDRRIPANTHKAFRGFTQLFR